MPCDLLYSSKARTREVIEEFYSRQSSAAVPPRFYVPVSPRYSVNGHVNRASEASARPPDRLFEAGRACMVGAKLDARDRKTT